MGHGQGSNGATKCTARPLSVVIQAAERALKKADKVSRKCAEAAECDIDSALPTAPVENELPFANRAPAPAKADDAPNSAKDAEGPIEDDDDVPLAKRARRIESVQQYIVVPDTTQREAALTNTKDRKRAAAIEPGVVDLISDSDSEPAAPPPEASQQVPQERLEKEKEQQGATQDAAPVPNTRIIEEIELGSTSEEEEEEEPIRERVVGAARSTREDIYGETLNSRLAGAPAAAAKTAPAASRPIPSLIQKRRRPETALDEPYHFSTHEAAKEFDKSFKKPRAKPGMGPSALQKRAKELLSEMTARSPATVKKTQNAWHSAAMAWRQKYMPSEEEVKRRQQEDSARMAEMSRHRTLRTPAQRAQVGGPTAGMGPQQAGPTLRQLEPPGDDADEADWRSYYRTFNQYKVEGAASFVQVLRTFKVPITDPGKVKDAYRLAVRMYHPDSNSKERTWNTGLYQKIEAEEIMKIINEKKPDDL